MNSFVLSDSFVDRCEVQGDEIKLRLFEWDEDRADAHNMDDFGKLLASFGDLYRTDDGLTQVKSNGRHVKIKKAADLSPLITDRIDLKVYSDCKLKDKHLSVSRLNTMLATDAFLDNFKPVDRICSLPFYLPDFSITSPGYNDGGEGYRYFYCGKEAEISDSMERINAFLDVMDFETQADRANTIAAALTVMLRNFWQGAKPVILVTATKSHSGKDTCIDFAKGFTKSRDISYQTCDWAFQSDFIKTTDDTDVGVVVVGNARIEQGKVISSAFLEHFLTTKMPSLTSPSVRNVRLIQNDMVIAISTNNGHVSEDLHNRSLPIHLSPKGHVADRLSPIGNPRYEYLPKYQAEIDAELRGMINRWVSSGCPKADKVKHSFSNWASTIGGILSVNGIDGFLTNVSKRRTLDDPLRNAITQLGTEVYSYDWQRIDFFLKRVNELGLVKSLIPRNDQANSEAQKRGLGVQLSKYVDENFTAQTDSEELTLKLECKRARSGNKNAQRLYRFAVLDRVEIQDEE